MTEETEVRAWASSNAISCTNVQSNDPCEPLKIIIGGGDHLQVGVNYVVARGDLKGCIRLLEKAIIAMKECDSGNAKKFH